MLQETNFEMMGTFFISLITIYIQILISLNDDLDYLCASVILSATTGFLILLAYPKMKCHFTPLITVSEVMFKSLPVSDGIYILYIIFF